MLSECYFCRGKVESAKVDVDFRWGRRLKVIRGVPAGVCRQCGERYFDAAVYKEMEKLGNQAEVDQDVAENTEEAVRAQLDP